MKIEIRETGNFLLIKRGACAGTIHRVLHRGKSEIKPHREFYYIEPKGGPIVIYENECRILDTVQI